MSKMSHASLFSRLWNDERGFIGTAAAITMAIVSGAGTAAQIYATKKAGDVNKRAIEAETKTNTDTLALEREQATTAAAIEREKMAANEKARVDAVALDRERYDAYTKANQPYWSVGQGAFKSLADLAGISTGGGGVSIPSFANAGPSGSGQAASVVAGAPDSAGASASGVAPSAGVLPTDAGRQRAAALVARLKQNQMPMNQGGGAPLSSLMQLAQLATMAGKFGGGVQGPKVLSA